MEKSLIQGRLHDFPASQSNISTLWSTFSAHASAHLSNQVRQIARDSVDFQHPKRQYPERPRPVSTVYFYQSEYHDNW